MISNCNFPVKEKNCCEYIYPANVQILSNLFNYVSDVIN